MKKIILASIMITFFIFVGQASAWEFTGTVTGVEAWDNSNYGVITIYDGSTYVRKGFRITNEDDSFTKNGLAIALTAYSLERTVTVEVNSGEIVKIYLNES